MIKVTKKHQQETYYLNHRLIQKVEKGPDNKSNIHMIDGKVFNVDQSKEEIEKLSREYEVSIISEGIKGAKNDD